VRCDRGRRSLLWCAVAERDFAAARCRFHLAAARHPAPSSMGQHCVRASPCECAGVTPRGFSSPGVARWCLWLAPHGRTLVFGRRCTLVYPPSMRGRMPRDIRGREWQRPPCQAQANGRAVHLADDSEILLPDEHNCLEFPDRRRPWGLVCRAVVAPALALAAGRAGHRRTSAARARMRVCRET